MAEVIDSSQPTIYQIRLRSHLSPDWTDWFGGLTVTPQEDGDTLSAARWPIRPRCMDCSRKCAIWECLWFQSIVLNRARQIR